MYTLHGKYSNAHIYAVTMDEKCLQQVHNMINHPAFNRQVAIMPDGHGGEGAVVGFTMPFGDKIIPSTIGADIGCSMKALIITPEQRKLLQPWADIEEQIREHVLFGKTVHKKPVFTNYTSLDELFAAANAELLRFSKAYFNTTGDTFSIPRFDMQWFKNSVRRWRGNEDYILNSIGTIGGGNHFFEVGDGQSTGNVYFTIHTGSRNLGKLVCDHWTEEAKKNDQYIDWDDVHAKIEKIRQGNGTKTMKKEKIQTLLHQHGAVKNTERHPDARGIPYLEKEKAYNYFVDMVFAQKYAQCNRSVILSIVADKILGVYKGFSELESHCIETMHNYLNFNDMIIRKGAVASYKNSPLIIPFTMEHGLWICEGASNPEWNYSAPHGAGRLMSRTDAKKLLDLKDYEERMKKKGIVTTSVCKETLDESPAAYKDPEEIKKAIQPTITRVIDEVPVIINVKSKEQQRDFAAERRLEREHKNTSAGREI